MSKRRKNKPTTRAEPAAVSNGFVSDSDTVRERIPATTPISWLCSPDAFEVLCGSGYTTLSHNPEICAAVDTVAKLIGSMTIHLMENTADGDIRVRNGLSRKIDIEPNRFMSRSNLMQWVVKALYLDGNGNAVVYPRTRQGFLEDLLPVDPARVAFLPDGWGYQILIDGKAHAPETLLHFNLNPNIHTPWMGDGYRIPLNEVAKTLQQAAVTKKGFMESKWKPSLVVKVDAIDRTFSSKTGRKQLLSEYIETSRAGEPWIVPAGQIEVQEVRPLSLADLAISDSVKLDKQTVASIIGVPPFVLGVGEFKRDAWNNFIAAYLMPLALIIQQELNRKLIYKPEWYFRFNPRSLYNYDLRELVAMGLDMYGCGTIDGNEVRDWAGLPPREGLNELVLLENYIPRSKIADQSKLN